MRVTYINLEGWQDKDPPYPESYYGHRPSNNGLDPANPGFAFHTKLMKFARLKSCEIVDGKIDPKSIRYED